MNLSNKKSNIIIYFLQLLNIKHTFTFSREYYDNHPYRSSLYGFSKILSDYKIENASIKIRNKEEALSLLEVPFIAHLNNELTIVYQITSSGIFCYTNNEKDFFISTNQFINIWSGAVLVAEPDEKSIEPDYNKNRKEEILKIGENMTLSFSIFILILIGLTYNQLYHSLGFMLSLIINTIGLYASYLLIGNSLQIKNKNADKICHSIKNGDCNNVLNSRGAKLFGLYGWGEIGAGYFISNMIIFLFFPPLIPYVALINICALPYSFWSVWYQKTKVGQWCPLCLIVQAILWGLFIINAFFHYIQIPTVELIDVLLTGCIYFISFSIINMLSHKALIQIEKKKLEYNINKLKAEEGVFFHVLHNQPKYMTNKSASDILFGNVNSKTLVTILINPHCKACALTHQTVKTLLAKISDKICIQYLISLIGSSSELSAKILISIYHHHSENEVLKIYDAWFDWGKYNIPQFINKYNIEVETENANIELKKHILWMENNDLTAAPMVLINGYEFPNYYNLDDLEYYIFTDD